MSDDRRVEAIRRLLAEIAYSSGAPELENTEFASSFNTLLDRMATSLESDRRTLETLAVDPNVAVNVLDELRKACLRWRRISLEEDVGKREKSGDIDANTAANLRCVIRALSRGEDADLGRESPEDWVQHRIALEASRRDYPMGIVDPNHRNTLLELLDIAYSKKVYSFIRAQLGASASEADEVVQELANRLYGRMLNADRRGERQPIKNPRNYAYGAARRCHIDFKSSMRGQIGEDERCGCVLPDQSGEEAFDLVVFNDGFLSTSRKAKALAWSAPGKLGPIYHQQLLAGQTRSKRHIAYLFEVGARLFAEYRRSSEADSFDAVIVSAGLQQTTEMPASVWLRPAVNQVIGLIEPEWGRRYPGPLPSYASAAAGVGAKESSNARRLDRICFGDPKADDGFGPLSVRRHGVGAIVGLVWGELISATGGRAS